MKKLFLLLLFCGTQKVAFTQYANDKFSLALGYGTGGIGGRFDLRLSEPNISDPFSSGTFRLYLDLTFKGKTFEQISFSFNHVKYPSDARITALGAGLSLDLKYNRVSLHPYAGLRNYSIRFTDQSLIDAIGERGLQRYWTDEYGNEFNVGPLVSNGYGDAFTFDLGGSVGYHLTPLVEIGALVGISPAKFSTAATLFGPYWGQAPYENPFYVQIRTIRSEIRLRINF